MAGNGADAHLVRRDAEYHRDAGDGVLGGVCAVEADEVAASVEALDDPLVVQRLQADRALADAGRTEQRRRLAREERTDQGLDLMLAPDAARRFGRQRRRGAGSSNGRHASRRRIHELLDASCQVVEDSVLLRFRQAFDGAAKWVDGLVFEQDSIAIET